jgi:hypothetical protein
MPRRPEVQRYGVVVRASSDQNGPVRPTSAKIATASSGDRPWKSGSSRSRYHATESRQVSASDTGAPTGCPVVRDHALSSSSDRKSWIVRQVSWMSSYQVRNGFRKWTIPSASVTRPSSTRSSVGAPSVAYAAWIVASVPSAAGTPSMSHAQLAQ